MATITPAASIPSATRVPVITWTGVTTGDTINPWIAQGQNGLACGIQFHSAAWAGTHKLQGSLDGTTYFDLKDVNGTTVSATADAYFEFSSSCIYLRPAASGGAAEDVNITLCMRGPTNA